MAHSLRNPFPPLGLALLLALGACSIVHETRGAPVPASLGLLQVGLSTKADVLALLGAPETVQRQFDGDMFEYSRNVSHSTRLLLVPFIPLYERARGESRSDRVSLLFDRDGVLAGVGVRREIPAEE